MIPTEPHTSTEKSWNAGVVAGIILMVLMFLAQLLWIAGVGFIVYMELTGGNPKNRVPLLALGSVFILGGIGMTSYAIYILRKELAR